MNIIQIADSHIRNEEPFYQAAIALDDYLLEMLHKETSPFIFLDSGDHYHTSKETGRVNGEVARLFLAIADIPLCQSIYVMQGNHDVKEDTGSALDLLRDISPKIQVIDKPYLISIKDEYVYLLPHCGPYSIDGYEGIKSYSNEDFHRGYWKDWDSIKSRIRMLSMHGGDESVEHLFMSADLSFMPLMLRSNGHIHKALSSSCLPSISITRRDEIDKPCILRKIDSDTWTVSDIEIPLFLNYAHIEYGSDIEQYFSNKAHILPVTSLIVDIYGHDDKDIVLKEYTSRWEGRVNPKLYIGDITPIKRRGYIFDSSTTQMSSISDIDIKGLLCEFCNEKGISPSIKTDILRRVS